MTELAAALDAPSTKTGRRHPGTSREAAARTLGRSGSKRRAVLAYLVEHGPATDEEIARALDMLHQTQTPRRLELAEMEFIEDSGERRLTLSGSPAIVWAPTDRGRLALGVTA